MKWALFSNPITYFICLQSADSGDHSTEESEFKVKLRAFVSDHEITVRDFDKLFYYLQGVLGAESVADLEELQADDLSEDHTGEPTRKIEFR